MTGSAVNQLVAGSAAGLSLVQQPVSLWLVHNSPYFY
jgi:hypothetical protein